MAFFPAYPLVMRACAVLVGDAYLAGIVVTVLAGRGGPAVLRLAAGPAVAGRRPGPPWCLILLYPYAFFLYGAVYADALFVAAILGAFLLLEHDHPWLAGLVGAVATAARPVGVVLVVALAVRALERRGALRPAGGGWRLAQARRPTPACCSRCSGWRRSALPVGTLRRPVRLRHRPGGLGPGSGAARRGSSSSSSRTSPTTAQSRGWLPVRGPPGPHLRRRLALLPRVFRRFGAGYGIYALLLIRRVRRCRPRTSSGWPATCWPRSRASPSLGEAAGRAAGAAPAVHSCWRGRAGGPHCHLRHRVLPLMTTAGDAPLTRLLIVNADDYGLTEGISRGILHAHREGIVTSTSAMPLGPAYPKVAKWLADEDELGVGVHLAAVGEDPPLLSAREIPSLVGKRGHLCETYGEFLTRAVTGRINPEELRLEFTAQLETVLELGVPITHLDAHQHLQLWPSVCSVVHRAGHPLRHPRGAGAPVPGPQPGGPGGHRARRPPGPAGQARPGWPSRSTPWASSAPATSTSSGCRRSWPGWPPTATPTPS